MGLLFWLRGGVTVSIHNDSNFIIKDIRLDFKGNTFDWAELSPHSKASIIATPKNELADLSITFIDTSGRQHYKVIDVYVEPGYRGKLNIRVDNNNNVTWETKIEIGPSLYK